MATKSSKSAALRESLRDLGFDLPELIFIHRDSLFRDHSVQIHEVDHTPKIFDPDIGSGKGVPARCFSSHGLDIGGKATTNDAGKLTWKLSNFYCGQFEVSEPVSFVATARSNSPVFLTSRTISTGDDLVIDVFSWDISGNPAPTVAFAWRCWTDWREPSPIID